METKIRKTYFAKEDGQTYVIFHFYTHCKIKKLQY